MAAPSRVPKPVLQLPARPASLHGLATRETRTILVTGPCQGERPPATDPLSQGRWDSLPVQGGGFAEAIAADLARTATDRVLIVETGRTRPDPGDPVSRPAGRGLRELLNEAYLGDLVRARTARFGLGDWMEILGAQEKSGDLIAVEAGRTFRLRFLRGSLRSISGPTMESRGDGSEGGLRAMACELVLAIAAMKEPECRFVPRSGPPPWAAGAWVPAATSCLDEVFRGPLADRLRRPYLAWEIAVHMADTPLPNLKRISGGRCGALSGAVRRPMRFLLERLTRGFAHVLVDVPSPARTGPAGQVAGLVDAALVVTTPAEADSPGVLRAIDELRMAGAPTVGVLVRRPAYPFTTAAAS